MSLAESLALLVQDVDAAMAIVSNVERSGVLDADCFPGAGDFNSDRRPVVALRLITDVRFRALVFDSMPSRPSVCIRDAFSIWPLDVNCIWDGIYEVYHGNPYVNSLSEWVSDNPAP